MKEVKLTVFVPVLVHRGRHAQLALRVVRGDPDVTCPERGGERVLDGVEATGFVFVSSAFLTISRNAS